MPDSKSVRWANENECYYGSPTSSSGSTLSASPSQATPPSPLPGTISIHEHLRFKPRLSFVYDVSKKPDRESLALDQDILAEAATSPPVRSVRIRHRTLPWGVTVQAKAEAVTVYELLRELYYGLQLKVTNEEMEQSKDENALKAFEVRCEKLKERNIAQSENEKRAGVRRLDYLRGKSGFIGFEVVPDAGEPTLRLHVR